MFSKLEDILTYPENSLFSKFDKVCEHFQKVNHKSSFGLVEHFHLHVLKI